jgi:hypothetical protein
VIGRVDFAIVHLNNHQQMDPGAEECLSVSANVNLFSLVMLTPLMFACFIVEEDPSVIVKE